MPEVMCFRERSIFLRRSGNKSKIIFIKPYFRYKPRLHAAHVGYYNLDEENIFIAQFMAFFKNCFLIFYVNAISFFSFSFVEEHNRSVTLATFCI